MLGVACASCEGCRPRPSVLGTVDMVLCVTGPLAVVQGSWPWQAHRAPES